MGQLVVSLRPGAPLLSSSSCQAAQPRPGPAAAATKSGATCSPVPTAATPTSLRRCRSGGSSSLTSYSSNSSRALLQPFKRTRLRATPGAAFQHTGHLVAPAAYTVPAQGEHSSAQSVDTQPNPYRSLSFRHLSASQVVLPPLVRQQQWAALHHPSPGGCCVIPLQPLSTAAPALRSDESGAVAAHTEGLQGQPPSSWGGWCEPQTGCVLAGWHI